ncbi:MAG: oligoribonuclease [Patescibacteria group bacterium]
MQRNDLLVWIDLEMTSLVDVRRDSIIEIAAVITDSALEMVAEGPDIIIHADRAAFNDIPEDVRVLHEKSGIIDASIQSSVSIESAEREVLSFIQAHTTPQSSPLCGNSIHMDRMFLRLQMPELDSYLHYRCIDVSTLKSLAQRWKPELYDGWQNIRGEKKHRAKDDILQSIEELKFYKKNFIAR